MHYLCADPVLLVAFERAPDDEPYTDEQTSKRDAEAEASIAGATVFFLTRGPPRDSAFEADLSGLRRPL